MATHLLDANGLKCPQPVLKVAVKAKQMQAGDILDVKANCSTFPNDIENWCKKSGKTLLFCNDEGGGHFTAQIQF